MRNKDQALANWAHHVAASSPCSPQDMALRIARFGDIPASPRAFVDTWVKGHERTLLSVIGSGVTHTVTLHPRDTISVPPLVHRALGRCSSPICAAAPPTASWHKFSRSAAAGYITDKGIHEHHQNFPA